MGYVSPFLSHEVWNILVCSPFSFVPSQSIYSLFYFFYQRVKMSTRSLGRLWHQKMSNANHIHPTFFSLFLFLLHQVFMWRTFWSITVVKKVLHVIIFLTQKSGLDCFWLLYPYCLKRNRLLNITLSVLLMFSTVNSHQLISDIPFLYYESIYSHRGLRIEKIIMFQG